DLSRNELTAISRRTFRGLTALKSLHLDGNQLKCIDEKALENLKSWLLLPSPRGSRVLEPGMMMESNLTYLALEPAAVNRLSTLRLTDNPVVCDCRMSRLAAAAKSAVIQGPRCPPPCRCTPEGTVDCREKLLTELPATIPHRATEIMLCGAALPAPLPLHPRGDGGLPGEAADGASSHHPPQSHRNNEITEVGTGAFSAVKRVARIDLSNNKITKLAADAFTGLTHLTSLVLYGNKIKDLPSGIFHGLASLQLLLLNSNEITCVRKDTFKDLENLKLLSLYDNNIRSLPNGTFDALTGIQTLHLGRNPFACDCSLRWLAAYLRKNPIETSGAKCDSPKRMSRKRIDALREENFKCKPGEETPNACGESAFCPVACTCEYGARAVSVQCPRASLGQVPRDLPLNTLALNNGITVIEDNAFDGAANIQELLLDGNLLTTVPDKMFFGLHSLSILAVSTSPGLLSACVHVRRDRRAMRARVASRTTPQHTEADHRAVSTSPGLLSACVHVCRDRRAMRARRAGEQHLRRTQQAVHADRQLQQAEMRPGESSDPLDISNNKISVLANTTFEGLSKLSTLIVSYNRLRCVQRDGQQHLRRAQKAVHADRQLQQAEMRPGESSDPLDISNNKISVLANNTFEGISKLSTLIDSYNRLRCVQDPLDISNNKISVLANNTFEGISKLSTLIDSYNRLRCVQSAGEYVEAGIARCAAPAAMRDKLILSTHSGAFLCTGQYTQLIYKCARVHEAGIARCAAPAAMRDKLILSTHSGAFLCTGQYTQLIYKCARVQEGGIAPAAMRDKLILSTHSGAFLCTGQYTQLIYKCARVQEGGIAPAAMRDKLILSTHSGAFLCTGQYTQLIYKCVASTGGLCVNCVAWHNLEEAYIKR
ncbi:Slit protein, partial [Operophtera brumata]